MTARSKLRGATAVAAILGWLVPTGIAHAQEADSQPSRGQQANTMDDIVVTARSRAETVLEAPLSITAFTAEALEEQQIDGMDDLAAATPGLVFQQAASHTSSRPVIRGMTQLSRAAGDVANTGVFVDGVYSPGFSGVDLSFVGLERVEVVRGPQSAAYGRNTFAGAVNYITQRPSQTTEYGTRVTVGDHGMASAYVYGAMPVSDSLALRLDAALSDTGGYFVNQANGDRLNASQASIVRLGARLQPSSNFDLYANYTHSEDESTPSPLVVVPDSSPRRVGFPPVSGRAAPPVGRRLSGEINDYSENYSYDPRAGGERESDRFAVIADLDLAGFTFSSRTGYEERDVSTLVDLDQTPGGTILSLPSGPFVQTASGDLEDRWEFSQDFRIQPDHTGRFNWVLGAYYSYERNNRADVRFCEPSQRSTRGGYDICPLPINDQPLIDEEFLIRNIFHSVYASVDYQLTDQITLTLEGRNTWERKRETVLQNNYGSDSLLALGDYTTEFEYFTPRFIAEYEPNEFLNLYFQAAKGTKSGGANPEAVVASEQIYDPESNWTYEIGAKGTLFDGAVQFAASLYHIDWTDQQVLVFASGLASDTSITGNIGESEIDGFELAANWRVTDWLRVNFAYNYNDARYVDAVSTSFANFTDCANLPNVECVGGLTTGRIDGNQMQYSPEHQGTLGVELNFPAFGNWEYYARTDVSANSDFWVDAGNVGYIPGSEQVRLRMGLQSEHLSVMGFCNNLFEDQTPVTAFESRDFFGNPHYYVRAREGRMCGVTVGASF